MHPQIDADERAAALVRSACSDDVRDARALLDADPGLARHDLACACVSGEAEEVTRRVQHDPAAAHATTGPLDRAPILYACFSRLPRTEPGRAVGIRAAVAALLDAGADPSAEYEHEGWRQMTLYGAAGIANDDELTRMLIDAGADPNDDDPVHTVGEALYHAVEFPDPTCARLLVRAGTRPSVVDYCLGRALNFADPAQTVMLCAEGARPSAENLHQAVFKRRPALTVRALLDAGAPADEPDDAGLTALRMATRWHDQETVALLRDRGADPAQVTAPDRALGGFLAGVHPRPDHPLGLDAMLDVVVAAGDVGIVKRLLDAGAAVDGPDGSDQIPLGQACWRGQPAVVRELIARGAALRFDQGSPIGAALHGSRHCHDPEGGPTMRTVQEIAQEPYAEIVRMLLAAGSPLPTAWEGPPPLRAMLADLGVEAP